MGRETDADGEEPAEGTKPLESRMNELEGLLRATHRKLDRIIEAVEDDGSDTASLGGPFDQYDQRAIDTLNVGGVYAHRHIRHAYEAAGMTDVGKIDTRISRLVRHGRLEKENNRYRLLSEDATEEAEAEATEAEAGDE